MDISRLIKRICVLSINRINWRFKRPYKIQSDNIEKIKPHFRPGLVILSHKNYELSNLFIRGYWKHAAIMVSDSFLVEATRKGVEKRRIEEALARVDDFIILEPIFCRSQTIRCAIHFAEKVVGLPYNFTFCSNQRSFYCTELIYKAFQIGNINLSDQVPDEQSSRKNEIVSPEHFIKNKELWQILNFCHSSC